MSNAKQGEYEKVALTEIFAEISSLNSSPISNHMMSQLRIVFSCLAIFMCRFMHHREG